MKIKKGGHRILMKKKRGVKKPPARPSRTKRKKEIRQGVQKRIGAKEKQTFKWGKPRHKKENMYSLTFKKGTEGEKSKKKVAR